MNENARQLMRLGQQMQASGRPLEAVGLYRQAVAAAPDSGIAEHNLASALGDSGLWAEAEAHSALAFRKGVDAPETWLIRGRALQALDKAGAASSYMWHGTVPFSGDQTRLTFAFDLVPGQIASEFASVGTAVVETEVEDLCVGKQV